MKRCFCSTATGETQMKWVESFSCTDMTARAGTFSEDIYGTFGKINHYVMPTGNAIEITHYFPIHPKAVAPWTVDVRFVWYEAPTVSADTKNFTVSIRGFADNDSIDVAMTPTNMPDAIAAGASDRFKIAELNSYTPIGSVTPGNFAIARFSRTDATSGTPLYVAGWIIYTIDLGV